MIIIESPQALQQQVEAWHVAGETIGFVPTMGALHAGHLSLVQRAREENSKVVVSVFVNPTQFRPGEDFEKYPRPFERDCELLQNENCDVVFSPSPDAMYGGNTRTFVDVEDITTRWEGEARPGHFRGVATIVSKLFNLARPHRAYFGEKDFQQLKVIEAFVRDLNFPVEVVPCPTLRESDGLAMSSRNVYLAPEERIAATTIFRALSVAQELAKNGERNGKKLAAALLGVLAGEPILLPEYAAIVDNQTLEPLTEITEEKPARAIIAARAGNTRLIDNITINAV